MQPITYHQDVEDRLEKFVAAKDSKLNLKLARLADELTHATDESLKKVQEVKNDTFDLIISLSKKDLMNEEEVFKFSTLLAKLEQLSLIEKKAQQILMNALNFWISCLE